ncbi:MAG TPA: efflux RND transporter periplasmic adaptor subunit [Noviherbaspirillum sp.]|jgi:membrane fusion protein (multidrug efflux system)|uniref:HlyD family secretion protein n=1 Tax=Noviherbaspirillum sp. TaxID=1926288 RepID=UPI002F92868D
MSNETSNATSNQSSKTGRGRLMILFTIVVVLALIAYGAWWAIFARHAETTDDAYVGGNVVQVTPQAGGTVVAIHADDTELVQAGAPLVELDRRDAQVALDQAQAQLAQAVREVRNLYANNSTLEASVRLRSADLQRAREDLARRQELSGSGAISREEIEHARSAVRSAESALDAARRQLASNQVLTDRTSVARHPNVQRAAAQVEAAHLAYARAVIPAPITGYVAKRSVQVGQRVAPGAPLLSIVPLDMLWVDANFKEVQISRMRIGQPVTLHSDLYGSDVVFHGKVAGLSAGTGSAFSLLPAQNASGNWIKVVQRVPVRVTLDPDELRAHPLRVGVSMEARVDISDAAGTSLAAGAVRAEPAYRTDAFAASGKEAEALIARIIADNGGSTTQH